MKIHVVHDTQGNIKGLVVPGPDYVDALGVAPQPGEEVSVVEQPDLPSEQLYEHLRDLYERFRIDQRSGVPTVVPKG